MTLFLHHKWYLTALGIIFCLTAHAEWRLIYQNDHQGNKMNGNKNDLFKAIQSGLPIRVGWKASRTNQPDVFVEHLIEPEFITNASNQEVFIQTPEHIAQTSYWDSEFQDFNTATVVWRGLLSTTGRFMAVWYNRATGQVIRKAPQRVVISWFADFDSI